MSTWRQPELLSTLGLMTGSWHNWPGREVSSRTGINIEVVHIAHTALSTWNLEYVSSRSCVCSSRSENQGSCKSARGISRGISYTQQVNHSSGAKLHNPDTPTKLYTIADFTGYRSNLSACWDHFQHIHSTQCTSEMLQAVHLLFSSNHLRISVLNFFPAAPWNAAI